ncbi:MAG: hypothetical protein GXO22_05665 [Aquificae bacterium]|nr:hypothetical protein [Aquificota bacterium]
MIQTKEAIIQLYDNVQFPLKGEHIQVKGVSTLGGKFLLEIEKNNQEMILELLYQGQLILKYKKLKIKFVSNSFEYFIENDNFPEVMKVLKDKYDFIDILKEANGYKIKTKDQFLKGILEIFDIVGV